MLWLSTLRDHFTSTCTELPLQRDVQVPDPSYLLLNFFALFRDLYLISLHAFVHFVKGVALLVKVSVLLCQNLFVLV